LNYRYLVEIPNKMHSFMIAAALVVGSMAAPAVEQPRAVVYNWETVYETEYLTITAPGPSQTAAPVQAPAQAPAPPPYHYGHGQHHSSGLKPAETVAPAPAHTQVIPPKSKPAEPLSASEPTDYSEKCVWHHNRHRFNHSASALTWSDSLAATAKKIADTCIYAHSMQVDGGGYGQNIAAGIYADKVGEVITGLFYNNEFPIFQSYFGYDQPNMASFEKWGHLTQVVWKDTTSVGCYTADCSGQGLANVGSNTPAKFTVCNYDPPGNYENEYGHNVGKPLGYPTLEGYSA